jgi:hypothetical protein
MTTSVRVRICFVFINIDLATLEPEAIPENMSA